ncbi:MAG TPA: hypothetical protein VK658_23195 [Chryseolinea sp.]|nr:hypothetical protein [Chryseolinea sp.]
MSKTYNVSDLFITRWEDLSPKMRVAVYLLQQELDRTPTMEGSGEPGVQYGARLIALLRHLRRNARLVDKLTVSQAVDIYNDLAFLNQPWYFFPDLSLKWGKTPDEKLARHSFDHFIYADNEYSSYVASSDIKYLRRLVATIYQDRFDKEDVDQLEHTIRLKDWQLFLVFFTFAHVRTFVVKRCKTLMPPGPGSDNSKAAPTGSMWLSLKHRLAETPAFQGYDVTGGSNMYSALDYLEDLAKRKSEKHGNNN